VRPFPDAGVEEEPSGTPGSTGRGYLTPGAEGVARRGLTRVRVIPLEEDTAERYAVIWERLRAAGTPIPTNDVWIAASAMQHGLAVLTTDHHYQNVVQVLVEYVAPRA